MSVILRLYFKYFHYAGVLFAFLALANQAKSQTFSVDSVIYNGPIEKFINLVFLSDGFKESELAAYKTSVQKSGSNFLNVSPFVEYRNYFNVFAINVPSKESGSDHPRTAPDCPPESEHPKLVVDTYFNTTFDSNNIHRLLVSNNYSGINSVIMNNFPLFDQNIMLVNTVYYGGSGGSTSIASLHSSTNELVLHESGHTFAALGDEYWAGDGYAGEKVNMTKETNPELVKWKNWLGVDGVGIYQHGTSGVAASWYRPHENCKMRVLGKNFCPVCKEAITLKILQKFGTPVKSYSPEQPTISLNAQPIVFKVSLYKPNPNTLRTKWFLNGNNIALNSDSLTLNSNQLVNGINSLSVQVLDTTALIRAESHAKTNTYTINWTVSKTISGSNKLTGPSGLKIYPNPFTSEFVIECEGNQEITKFEIINAIGQVVSSGSFTAKTIVDATNLDAGIYIVKIENKKTTEFKKIIKAGLQSAP
jgi:hypothetical protein